MSTGIPETSLSARKYQQFMNDVKFSKGVYEPLIKSMLVDSIGHQSNTLFAHRI
jgi:hypothetical protein